MITNVNRVAGTIVGSEITKLFGEAGLPEDTVKLRFTGSAGQSFGAFIPNGMTLYLTGDANDYIGKGLSGGKIIVKAHEPDKLFTAGSVIAGNVAFYGSTSGEAYVSGRAGERFAVRNSGADIVVEGIGDHGCEYMTGGRVVILGDTGKNFGAGMSGGIAYVLADNESDFVAIANGEMVSFESLTDKDEINQVKTLVQNHFKYTESAKANYVLENWGEVVNRFIKVIPNDFKRMIEKIEEQKADGLTDEEAAMRAFQANAGQGKKASVQQGEILQ
jgi:glutamate synthase (NADPH/NADH) large chain